MKFSVDVDGRREELQVMRRRDAAGVAGPSLGFREGTRRLPHNSRAGTTALAPNGCARRAVRLS